MFSQFDTRFYRTKLQLDECGDPRHTLGTCMHTSTSLSLCPYLVNMSLHAPFESRVANLLAVLRAAEYILQSHLSVWKRLERCKMDNHTRSISLFHEKAIYLQS